MFIPGNGELLQQYHWSAYLHGPFRAGQENFVRVESQPTGAYLAQATTIFYAMWVSE